MTRQPLIWIVFFAMTAIFTADSYGQTDVTIPDTKGDKESFMKLNDSEIKREIASFTITGTFKTKTDSLPKTKVNEIPLIKCTDSSAYFEKGNIMASELIVGIYSCKFDTAGHKFTYVDSINPFLTLIDNKPFWGTDGGIPKEKIKKVKLIFYKSALFLPDSALEGLYEPNFCYTNKTKGTQTTFCKVFQSTDNRRIYIYMLNSDGAGGYEVTWVIQDRKYYTRFVDYGF